LERVAPRLSEGLARTLMLNPPYGERIEARGRVARSVEQTGMAEEFYPRLAAHWKRHFGGWTAWVLSPDMKLPSRMRLKESRRIPMWNGPIECRLFRFDLVSGSMRGEDQPAAR
jgi:putative N6-adenine-specific DNA methylase